MLRLNQSRGRFLRLCDPTSVAVQQPIRLEVTDAALQNAETYELAASWSHAFGTILKT